MRRFLRKKENGTFFLQNFLFCAKTVSCLGNKQITVG